MIRRFMLVAIIIISALAFSTQFYRTVEDTIEILPDGSAVITRVEQVPSSELSKIYIAHAKALSDSKEIFQNFYDEISKDYYFLYGSAPGFGDRDLKVDIDRNGNYTSKIKMKVTGLLTHPENNQKLLQFSRKRFAEEKVMLKYFENVLDGKIFETAFLNSEKNSIKTTKTTTIILPEGSKILDVLSPFQTNPENGWELDFGGGTKFYADFDIQGNAIKIKEEIITGGGAPERILKDDNADLFEQLMDYTALDIIFANDKVSAKLTQPTPYKFKDDYSGSWSFYISQTLSHQFTYYTLTVKPGMTASLNFGASLLWQHYWKKVSWWKYKYVLKKFQTTVSINPSLTPFVEVSSGASISKSWSYNITTKTKWITFWVSCVPVTLVMEVKFDANAEASISGVIGFNVSSTLSANTSLTVKYQNGWSKSVSKSYSYSGVQFSADAKVNASAKGSLPLTLSAYVYYIAGPYVQFEPWIKGETFASAGSSNQVGYKVTAGFNVNGGVHMAGWLKNLCDNIPSVSYTFWSKSWTLASSTYTF
ncbi:hypothetical protein AT15_02225 [Kosmotoga arenicorallina S304]|uniref:Uncharacterized protein n=1 Tax=Kosmotoga arenicorallina S304 TaxID=1453497 RepID=A0A176JZG3_9BACT|nr:hypothetical protein [Kosmotoga arenicorallina]OAA29357.1 hypothetical protein AT15_02225 [Kosmotoga arenicorallina S304]